MSPAPDQAFRRPEGGRIDRTRPLAFTFDGRSLEGFAGDTLASALLANGIHLVARSFKYHRPRGIFSAGAEEPNALVRVGAGGRAEPNLRATQVELHDGLVAESQNRWPRLTFDAGAAAGWFAPLLVAGFYYKTFMGPGRALWQRLYEPAIRRMAGMGRAPDGPDPDSYDRMDAHADVAVIGGGPAGLAAALAAGRAGARVVLIDEQAEPGGSLLHMGAAIDGRPAAEWAATVAAELSGLPEVRVLTRTTAFGFYDHGYIAALERRADHLAPAARPAGARQRLWHVRARAAVLATGAHERPLVFPDNDRPGVLLAAAAHAYVNRWAVLPGRRAIVFTNNCTAYAAAFDLQAAGVEIRAIVDLRARPPLAGEAAARGIEVLAGHTVTRTHGGLRIYAIEAMRRAGPDGVEGAARLIDGDCLLVSGGWSPAVHLFAQSGGRLEWDPARGLFRPNVSLQAEWSVGAAKGTEDLAGALAEGFVAGAQLARDAGFGDGVPPPVPAVAAEAPGGIEPVWLAPGPRRTRGKRFVDLQNDVTAADIALATREGLVSIEHVKRYTTAGMGTDQGKTANVNALALVGAATGRPPPAVGTTTFRPPYTPVAFGALAGRDVGRFLDPARLTPLHGWHAARGAVFEDVGQWKRPRHYPRAGEDLEAALAREARAVRTAAGIMDASTLGKIEVSGPDAARFLDRIYTNTMSTLAPGRCRYGLMCRDDGMVFDDGVVTRLGPERFHLTTTTGNADAVLDWLEEWLQTEWTDLKVHCVAVDEEWAAFALSGPRAREIVASVAEGPALDPQSFPHMSMREARVAGVPARLFRVSFTGEPGFEVYVPWRRALPVWEALVAAGAPHGLEPYGTEAMHLLRAEKGYIIVGQETDGSTTPDDLGLSWLLSKKKDFLGRRGMARPALRQPGRKQLVGLLFDDPARAPMEGAQLTAEPKRRPPVPMLGHVTSAYRSPTLGRGFALALVAGGRQRMGERIFAVDPKGTHAATVVEPVFYDPDGSRLHG